MIDLRQFGYSPVVEWLVSENFGKFCVAVSEFMVLLQRSMTPLRRNLSNPNDHLGFLDWLIGVSEFVMDHGLDSGADCDWRHVSRGIYGSKLLYSPQVRKGLWKLSILALDSSRSE